MATHSRILAWRIPKGRGAWWATVHEVAESRTGLSNSTQLSTAHTYIPSLLNYRPHFILFLPVRNSRQEKRGSERSSRRHFIREKNLLILIRHP